MNRCQNHEICRCTICGPIRDLFPPLDEQHADDCPACNTPAVTPHATNPVPCGGVLTDHTCRTCHMQWTCAWWEGT